MSATGVTTNDRCTTEQWTTDFSREGAALRADLRAQADRVIRRLYVTNALVVVALTAVNALTS